MCKLYNEIDIFFTFTFSEGTFAFDYDCDKRSHLNFIKVNDVFFVHLVVMFLDLSCDVACCRSAAVLCRQACRALRVYVIVRMHL